MKDKLGALTGPVQQVNGRSAHPIAGIGHCGPPRNQSQCLQYICMPNVSNDISRTRMAMFLLPARTCSQYVGSSPALPFSRWKAWYWVSPKDPDRNIRGSCGPMGTSIGVCFAYLG